MTVYRGFPTRYTNLSTIELESLFSTKEWFNLSLDEKLDACQEVENRYATEHQVPPCYVISEPMNGLTYGEEGNQIIALNENILDRGVVVSTTEINGQTFTYEDTAPASNWNMLDTIYHEGTHGIQEANGTLANTYIDSKMDYDLYRIQGCEKEAFAAGQSRTMQAIDRYQTANNTIDANTNDYLNDVANSSFVNAQTNAAARYNDPNIESTLNSFIDNQDLGVHPQEVSESYEAIQNQYEEHINNLTNDNNIQHDQESDFTIEAGNDYNMDNDMDMDM